MECRNLGEVQPSNVTPLRHQRPATTTSCVVVAAPEPAQLYGLTVLAFLLHTPETAWLVRVVWARLAVPAGVSAYRIHEGF
jgi:hypothetical protein